MVGRKTSDANKEITHMSRIQAELNQLADQVNALFRALQTLRRYRLTRELAGNERGQGMLEFMLATIGLSTVIIFVNHIL